MITAAMDGHLGKLLIINELRKPRGFIKINGDRIRLLPCIDWHANRTAWVGVDVFEKYLIDPDTKMCKEQRRCLLF